MTANKKQSQTLWSNSTRDRFFVVPDNQVLPLGEYEIQTVTGRQQKVEPSALAQYELSKVEATKWLTSQLTQVVHQGKDAILTFLERLRASWQKPMSNTETTGSATKPREHAGLPQPGPGVRLFSALSGEPVEILQEDPDAIGRATRKILTDLKEFFESSTSPDATKLQDARDTARAFRARLLSYGLKVSEEFNDLPDTLHRLYYASDEPQALQRNAARLKELADFIEQMSSAVVKKLREQGEDLRNKANPRKDEA